MLEYAWASERERDSFVEIDRLHLYTWFVQHMSEALSVRIQVQTLLVPRLCAPASSVALFIGRRGLGGRTRPGDLRGHLID